MILEFELRRGEASASLLGDRAHFTPFGVLGGHNAQAAVHTFKLQGQNYLPPHKSKDEGVLMHLGDALRL